MTVNVNCAWDLPEKLLKNIDNVIKSQSIKGFFLDRYVYKKEDVSMRVPLTVKRILVLGFLQT